MRWNENDYDDMSEFDDFDYLDTRAARRRANKSKHEELILRRKRQSQKYAKHDRQWDEMDDLADDFSIDLDDYSFEEFDTISEAPIRHT